MKNPLTRLVVRKSKVDKETAMLSCKYCKRLLLNTFYNTKVNNKGIILTKDNVKSRYTYFFPWRNKIFSFIEYILFWLPIGAQYCVYARK